VVFDLTEDAPDAPTVIARARDRGLVIFAFGPRTLRVVTHLNLTREECRRGAEILLEIVDQKTSQ